MTPYRTAAPHPPAPQARGRTSVGRLRSFWRRLTVYFSGGPFLRRYPVKCPCGKRSWDPEAIRKNYLLVRNAGEFSHRANEWRCGQRHGLLCSVRLG